MKPDCIVVGAGIVGAACAEALSSAGSRVLVLEARSAAGAATAAGMGHLVVMDDSPAQLALTSHGVALWRALLPELPPAVEHQPCGTLWLAADDEELAHCRAKLALYRSHGLAAELLDARSLAETEPQLRPGLAGALLVPGDGVLYPPAAARFLLERARARGAELREGCPVLELRPGGARTGAGWIEGGLVVNAAGAEAPRLTPGLPIEPRKGHLVVTERLPGFVRHQLVELGYLRSAHVLSAPSSVAFNVQPRATGQVLVGSSRELVGWDRSLNRRLLDRMLRRACSYLPGLSAATTLRAWTGFRPATPDKLPLIGALEPGLWLAAGHEGLGITTALATGRLLAELVTARPPSLDPAPFTPARALAAA